MKLACLILLCLALAAQDGAEHFEMKVRPVLAKNCFGCHTASAMGGLRMDSRDALLKGGRTGAAIVVGKPEQSLLVQVITHTHEKLKMPPSGKMADSDVKLLAEWVRAGAVFPDRKPSPATADEITAEQRSWWSFQPVRKPLLPPVKNSASAKNEIDRFVLARLEQEGLLLARPADRRTLIRRATFDLLGLPPTIAEVEAFVQDRSPNAWEKVVDRLLASPHYGERWGRYWLDVARYADDKLNSPQDEPYANSFRYRNWVIDSLNRDISYKDFVKAQIAGDLMGKQWAAGTGFFALSPEMQDERVDALTRGFLGLTVACAQCHDHKFDPIPTRDFYSLQGIFNSTELAELPLADPELVRSWEKQKKELEVVEKRLKDFYDLQSRLVGEMLASRTSRYLLGTQGYGTISELDRETLERWKKYVSSDRLYHPFLDEFRRLAKARAPEAELAAEARRFELKLLAIHEEKKLVDEKNKVLLGVDPTRNDLSQPQLEAMDRDKTV